MSSSDSNARRDLLWAEHYRVASERRRARGWHRRDDRGRSRSRSHGSRRVRFSIAAVVAFVALTIVALAFLR